MVFAKTTEKEIARAIVEHYASKLLKNLDPDVIVVGGGPSGLVAARECALAGARTIIVERNNYLGGGFWIGGYLMNSLTVRAPGDALLRDIGIPLEEAGDGLYVADGPHACSKLIGSTCDAGVWIMNMTDFQDLVVRDGARIAGAVVNWSPVAALPRQITCVDPIAIESKVVIDATGHDAVAVRALERRGVLRVPGMGMMWVEGSEDAIVKRTGEIHPGLIVTGMAVSTAYGLPRMGPTFGAMILSGKKAGELAVEMLNGALPSAFDAQVTQEG
ncbi:MAG: sulfide-dependent adenosine diphosphate thiazole synthase [Candidatus Thermoplasmatota archaeon]